MRKDAITLTTLASRLERVLQCDVGMAGLETLLHGWIRKSGVLSRDTLRQRKKSDGEAWLGPYEARLFSKYAGSDLTQE